MLLEIPITYLFSSSLNFNLNFGGPAKYSPQGRILKWAKKNKSKINIFKDPKKAVEGVDCIMTDKWVSMNDKVDKKKKKSKQQDKT